MNCNIKYFKFFFFLFILLSFNSLLISCSQNNYIKFNQEIANKKFYEIRETEKKYILKNDFSKLNVFTLNEININYIENSKKIELYLGGPIIYKLYNSEINIENGMYVINGNLENITDGSIQKEKSILKIKFDKIFGELYFLNNKILFYIDESKDFKNKVYNSIKMEFIDNFKKSKITVDIEIINNKLKYFDKIYEFKAYLIYNYYDYKPIINHYVITFYKDNNLKEILIQFKEDQVILLNSDLIIPTPAGYCLRK